MSKKILITKDVLRKDYLPCYGNKYWKTPNIDELASKGTIFRKHYAAGASTVMSTTSMFTGLYNHQMDRKRYESVKQNISGKTFFDKIQKKGYECHVILPDIWLSMVKSYTGVFPDFVKAHGAQFIGQSVKDAMESGFKMTKDDDLVKENVSSQLGLIKRCIENDKNTFIWIHLPHVMLGRTGYGSDIDAFDYFIGEVRKVFNDDEIYVSADHGHMNCQKGIPVYAFHVYNGTINIPLITPRINNLIEIDFPTSNIHLYDIIVNDSVPEDKYVYADTQYYLQTNRKIAIIKGKFKYIYNKRNSSEELYDMEFDKHENVNLLIVDFYDKSRKIFYPLKKIYHYPYWNEIEKVYNELKEEKDRIWKTGNLLFEFISYVNVLRKRKFLKIVSSVFINHSVAKGISGSRAQKLFYEE